MQNKVFHFMVGVEWSIVNQSIPKKISLIDKIVIKMKNYFKLKLILNLK